MAASARGSGFESADAGSYSLLSGMQEQYELVYDAVIELFKRQIKALDAQADSAASQVKAPGVNAVPLAALGMPAAS